jgi:hypothetical protein
LTAPLVFLIERSANNLAQLPPLEADRGGDAVMRRT